MAVDPSLEGRRVRLRDGTIARVTHGQLVQETAPPARGTAGSRSRIPPQDLQALNALRDNARAAQDLERTYNQTRDAVNRLQPGPYRGRFLEAAIPEEEQRGILDSIGSVVVGGPARITGAISPQNVEDFQAVSRARSIGVLARQLQQRGVQTESDAARMALAELSAEHTTDQNNMIIDRGIQAAQRDQARAAYYNAWASRFGGINGTRNSRGQTVDEAWHQFGQAYTNQMFRSSGGQGQTQRPTIRRIR